MRRISRCQWQRQPWRNGGGVTWELWRDGDGPPGFVVRLSCAEVASDGPFSRFPGVDRVIALVDGAGMVLDGASPHRLDDALEPHSFRGEAEVHGRLLGGPVLDFNLMTARGEAKARVRRLHLAPGERVELVGSTVVAFAPRGGVAVSQEERRYALVPMDTAVAVGRLTIDAGPQPEPILVAEIARRDAPTRVAPPPGLAALFESAVVEIAGPPLAEPSWVITACNPHGSLHGAEENAERMAALEAVLRSRGLVFRHAVGRDASGDWAEPSFAITGSDRETALALASKFDQDAVYEFDAVGNRVVLWC
ncbi:MAG: HutD family protein [Myxococcales bacterium]|nr:HutD family protein [Myxococcales bacterium]